MSEQLIKLFQNGEILTAIWETVYMTGISTIIAYLIGIPLGIILYITEEKSICPCKILNIILGFIVNIMRSVPFLILMVAVLPVAKIITGSSVGNEAMIVTLVIGSAPFIARMVQSSVQEVDRGVIEAAQSMGATNFQIIMKVIIPEAKPSLITGTIITTITVIGYSAMASTIGGGGLGAIAYNHGFLKSQQDVIWIAVLFTVVIVQIIQVIGNLIVKKTDKRIKH